MVHMTFRERETTMFFLEMAPLSEIGLNCRIPNLFLIGEGLSVYKNPHIILFDREQFARSHQYC